MRSFVPSEGYSEVSSGIPVAQALSTVLVNGGGGFLGSHLCERLLQHGHRVICLDNFSTGRRANVDH
ncbi:NAD-dependent epimerase/dehydratase family protein, partial [Rhizobium johnstonii]|uniref:NAD-dependent epimerase/dehydratase family protein n=1 Tax=Rhizobium johnstonii TaxID=3019933 RepID=UPI003F9DBDDF